MEEQHQWRCGMERQDHKTTHVTHSHAEQFLVKTIICTTPINLWPVDVASTGLCEHWGATVRLISELEECVGGQREGGVGGGVLLPRDKVILSVSGVSRRVRLH